jgi:hypothetical protein
MDKVNSCSLCSNPAQYWALLKNLSGKLLYQAPNQPIYFNNKPFTKPKAIAD